LFQPPHAPTAVSIQVAELESLPVVPPDTNK
jgi:hypothetical protein